MSAKTQFGYSVLKSGSTYVVLTMHPSLPDGLNKIVTYWGCSPVGPWNGPTEAYDASLDGKPRKAHTVVYNPHVHSEWDPADGGWLVSYDVNDVEGNFGGWRNIHDDVELYRPRFVRMQFGAPSAAGVRGVTTPS